MHFGNHLKYDEILKLTSNDIGYLLSEIKTTIENRIEYALIQIDTKTLGINAGAVDQEFLLRKRKLAIYTDTVELLINELNALGHKLTHLDQDIDMDFESTSTSWVTRNEAAEIFGLDIEIFPNKAKVLWVLSPKA